VLTQVGAQFCFTLTLEANQQYLPDNPEHPENGNRTRLVQARTLYGVAQAIFAHYGESHKADMLQEVSAEIAAELGNGHAGSNGWGQTSLSPDFGITRIAE
jgi:hypothetical protein